MVDIWMVPLDGGPEVLRSSREVLGAEERERADRFVFERHRNRWTVCRGALRELLSRYLNTPPAAIEFETGPHGKPYLAGSRALEFNVSHSGGMGLIAVAQTPIGVDVEELRPMPDALDIAKRFFAPDEWVALAQVEEAERTATFFRCWTRKEAFIKATGWGISLGLESFSVSTDERAELLRCDNAYGPPAKWALADIAIGPIYAAALAASAPFEGFNLRTWTRS